MPPFAFTDRPPDSAADEGGPEFDPARPLPPPHLRAEASGSADRSGGLGDEGELSVDASFEFEDAVDSAFDRRRLDHSEPVNDRRPSPKKVLFERLKRKAHCRGLPKAILLLPPPASSILSGLVRPIADR
ncbi:MAG: hypothetical protein ISN28_16080 [Ectothiorhodospiraceae bacterium AqS1]|nr:hypothetical protein [Ectothiorhodospiraceae bacterium AqS1]